MEKERRRSSQPAQGGSDPSLEAGSHATARERLPEPAPSDLERVVSLVAHDLRGPMATLIGYAQLMSQTATSSPAVREKAAKAVLQQARRLNTIVENMLQASRLSAGRLRLEIKPTDLAALAQQVTAEQQALAPHHNISLRGTDVPLVGQWDQALLGLAMGNLISNAVKFSPGGGEVAVVLWREGDRALISVNDRGIGISSQDLPALFQPYIRPARTERFPGVGIGLFVTKGLVEAQGGRVDVESSAERGTTFRVSLPLQPGAPPTA